MQSSSSLSLWVSVRRLQNLGNEPGTWQTSGLINRKSVAMSLPPLSFVQVAWFVACFNRSMAPGVSGTVTISSPNGTRRVDGERERENRS